MDHHCPWINNCVGFQNYRYFCLFMLYLAVSCAVVVVMAWPIFWATLFHPRGRRHRHRYHSNSRLPEYDDGDGLITISVILSASIFFALCFLGGFHVFLVLTNQTTIEFHCNLAARRDARRKGEIYRNPWNLGMAKNFHQVFGPSQIS